MKRVLMAMVAAVALSASPLAAGTPQFRAWDLCTPGSFRVCASVSVSLEYVNGPEAAGWSNGDFTRVVVTIANLQGQPGHEGDDIAGIYWAGFSGLSHVDAPPGFHSDNNFGGTMVLEGAGSEGSPGSEHTFLGGNNMLFSGPINGANQFIWGCSGSPEFWVELWGLEQPMSCGGRFILSVNLDSHIELTPHTQPGIGAVYFPTQPDVHPGGFAVCSDRPGDPRCVPTTRVPTTAVPEPATMLLMATGLAGIGGAAIRRRRKVA